MGKKKRGHPDVEEILARPWCYYCERDFDDLKILIQHQKAKHFKCDRCNRRLNTAGGLNVHMTQVHKESLTSVDNALPNRSDLNVEIFGMEGIPDEIVQQHKQRVLQQFYEAENQRRAATGNPAPGGNGNGPSKKPKIESSEEIKARLAAFKAKKAAEAAGAVGSNTDGTPTGAGQGPDSPAVSAEATWGLQPQNMVMNQGWPNASDHPYQSSSNAVPNGLPTMLSPPTHHAGPYMQGPQGYAPPPMPFPPGMPQYPQYPPYSSHPPQGGMHYQPPLPYGGPPPHQMPYHPNRSFAGSPGPNGSFSRPPGLPSAPGLPQRPSFGAPQVNSQQMQQFHQGHVPEVPQQIQGSRRTSQDQGYGSNEKERSGDPAQPPTITGTTVDELIASVTGSMANREKTPVEPALTEKKVQKSKTTTTRLVYTDNDVSPEEKMARMAKYAFDPAKREEEPVLGDIEAAVTGPAVGADDVMDPSG